MGPLAPLQARTECFRAAEWWAMPKLQREIRMVDWKPIPAEALGKRIAQGVARMSPPQRKKAKTVP